MIYRDEIKDLAKTINDGLTIYIAIHDAIIKDAYTFKSSLKNLLGRGVPMSKLLEDSEGLLLLWDTIHQKMEAFRQSAYMSLSKDEKRYFDILSNYGDAVRKTVIALIDRQRLLNERSNGGSMTWNALQKKERNYQMAIQEYMTLGNELNDAAPIIFG